MERTTLYHRNLDTILNKIRQSRLGIWSVRLLHWFDKQILGFTTFGYIFLYMFTGYDKLQKLPDFIAGISKIPYAGRYAELIGRAVPVLEILLAVVLIIPNKTTRKISLGLSTILMGIFTVYIALILAFVPDRLCHCGGVTERMGWTTHLIFNIFWLGAGIYSMYKLKIYKPLN